MPGGQFDLFNKKLSETYHRIVQFESGSVQFLDGRGDSITDHYGEMFISSSATETQIDTQYVWAMVTASMETGLVQGMSYSGSGELLIDRTGNYQVSWHASTMAVGTNKTFQIGLSVNHSDPDSKTVIERRYSTSDVGASSGAALLNLNSGDTIDFHVRNITDSSNIIIKFANIQAHEI